MIHYVSVFQVKRVTSDFLNVGSILLQVRNKTFVFPTTFYFTNPGPHFGVSGNLT